MIKPIQHLTNLSKVTAGTGSLWQAWFAGLDQRVLGDSLSNRDVNFSACLLRLSQLLRTHEQLKQQKQREAAAVLSL